MESIIGKKYLSGDNSYEVNLTKPYFYGKNGAENNRKYLALNKILCTIVTEPFTIRIQIRDKPVNNLSTYQEKTFIIITDEEGDSHLQLFYKSGIQK